MDNQGKGGGYDDEKSPTGVASFLKSIRKRIFIFGDTHPDDDQNNDNENNNSRFTVSERLYHAVAPARSREVR